MANEDYLGRNPKIPGKPTSVWLDTTTDPKFPVLSEDIDVDVAIVGGGMVGVLSAFLLALAGKKVAILEARELLSDVTGHTTAKISTQHGLIYDYLLGTFGKEKARNYYRANQAGARLIDATIKEYKISCNYEVINSYVYTEAENELGAIKKEVEACKKIEIQASFVEEIDLPFKVLGSICFPDQAQFHPRKFLLSIVDQLKREKVAIYEKTRVSEIIDGKICEVVTPGGKVFAKKVIVATHFPIYDEGKFFTRLLPQRSYVLAAKLNQEIPQGIYYGLEGDGSFHSFRSMPLVDDRLFFIGGEPHKAGEEDGEDQYLSLLEYANKKFRVKNIEYHWSTQDNFPLDRVPYVGLSPKSQNVYIVTGFSGWGMSSSAYSAILLTNLITEKENPWGDLFDPKRSAPVMAWGKYIELNTGTLKRKIGDQRKKDQFQFLTEIPVGSGAIVEVEGEKTAVYRDEEGEFLYLYPKCVHMGCIVNWNEAEKTWDCPCHGSRYDAKGRVIHAPANENLRRRHL